MEEDEKWVKINEKKRNNYTFGMAVNNVSRIYNSVEAILAEGSKFCEDVKTVYKLYKQIHKELKDEGEHI